ncbi:MAG TPA: hypothetical protein DCM05_15420 [Elusimicrobia bacterium]|nr:hypothetical protein [Elusimicrobiota bacterium]
MSRGHRAAPEASSPIDGIAFSLVMAVAAFLGRENPRFVHPHILWCFLALLSFNLLNFAWLFGRLEPGRRIPLVLAVNVLLITMVVFYSGGPQSYFWVMFLLPIFTACLALSRRGIWATTAGALLALAVFHWGALAHHLWAEVLELLTKAATLAVSAVVLMRVSFDDRSAREKLEEERKSSDEERRKLREQLQHMDRLATMGTLSASIAHELNSPLATILGFAQVGLSGSIDQDKIVHALHRIEEGALRCKRTIQGILAFSRGAKAERAPVDVNALLHECLELKRFEWISGHIRTEETYEQGLPLVPLSGPEFQQVVFNLLTNAEQAIRSHGEGRGRIRLKSELAGGRLRVLVSDDGPGIPPEVLDRIWEPFFTTKPVGTGTGLGLGISKQIIEDQGGRLCVRSEPGRGASFIIDLPAPSSPAEAPAAPAQAPAAPSRHILVAEDDPALRPLLFQLLKPFGHPVRFAETFDEAARMVRQDPPVLLVSDLKMPGMPALDFFVQLRAEGRLERLPILPISGSVPGDALSLFLKSRGLSVLEKPFEIEEFKARVKKALPPG